MTALTVEKDEGDDEAAARMSRKDIEFAMRRLGVAQPQGATGATGATGGSGESVFGASMNLAVALTAGGATDGGEDDDDLDGTADELVVVEEGATIPMKLFGETEEREQKTAAFEIKSEGSVEEDDPDHAMIDPNAEAAAAGELLTVTFGGKFVLAAVVVFLMLYPTLIEKCLLMSKCDTIDFGPPSSEFPAGGVKTLLDSDRSLDCDQELHQQYTFASYFFGVAYGIGIPGCITLYISHLKRTKGPDVAFQTFAYYTAGYDKRTWWWEGVILTRKLGIIAISVFIQSDGLRLYIAMWFLAAGLMGHIQLEPYTVPMLHNTETLSLTTIVLTLNVALLFEYSTKRPWLFTTLAVIVIAMNLFAILVIFFFMGRELTQMFGAIIQKHGDRVKDRVNKFLSKIPLVIWWRRRKAEEAQRIADAELARQRDELLALHDGGALAGATVGGTGRRPSSTGTHTSGTGNESFTSVVVDQNVHDGALLYAAYKQQRAAAKAAKAAQRPRKSLFGRLVDRFEGKPAEPAPESSSDDDSPPTDEELARAAAVAKAMQLLRGRDHGGDVTAAALDGGATVDPYVDTWHPPETVEALWSEAVDDDGLRFMDLLTEEVSNFRTRNIIDIERLKEQIVDMKEKISNLNAEAQKRQDRHEMLARQQARQNELKQLREQQEKERRERLLAAAEAEDPDAAQALAADDVSGSQNPLKPPSSRFKRTAARMAAAGQGLEASDADSSQRPHGLLGAAPGSFSSRHPTRGATSTTQGSDGSSLVASRTRGSMSSFSGAAVPQRSILKRHSSFK